MKYLVIEAPPLTDEAAVNLLDFFNELIDAFGEHYHYQIERYYRESVTQSMPDINARALEDDPPF